MSGAGLSVCVCKDSKKELLTQERSCYFIANIKFKQFNRKCPEISETSEHSDVN